MVIHFINLSCWEKASSFIEPGDIVYCDTVTMKLLIYVLTQTRVNVVSGVRFFNEIKGKEMSFLLAREHSFDDTFILPNYTEGNIYVDGPLQAFLSNIKKSDVCLGISSPKQNELARCLEARRPELRYICLGAAIYDNNDYKTIYDRFYINWLYFMIKDPERSFRKIKSTIIAIYLILSDLRIRKDFVNFVGCNFS